MGLLTTIKKLCNVPQEDEAFDMDFITYINTSLGHLDQLGVPVVVMPIADDAPSLEEVVNSEDQVLLALCQTFIGLEVRLLFDPPTSTGLMDALKQKLSELEWRITVRVETT